MGRDLSGRYFPFERFNLRANPFRALTEDEWAALAWLHPALLSALGQPFPILQIRGESGRGKSSALLAVKRELLARGRDPHYLYLPPGVHRLKRDQQWGDPLLLDEIERLPIRVRRRLFQRTLQFEGRPPGLVFSSHEDLTQEIERLRPAAVLSLKLPPVTRRQLMDLLHHRIRAASPGGGLPIWFAADAVSLLIEVYGDDLRGIERMVYEVFQRLEEPGEIKREALIDLLRLSGGLPGLE
ncbi:MAG: hypothetical protein P8X64_07285 [Anaerolineales bacterium]|jgi:hypothetical protein